MAGFLYYASGKQGTLSLDELRTLGLGYAFSVEPACADVEGPDGKRGLICADTTRDDAPPIGYSPNTQRWAQLPSKDGETSATVWVGMCHSAPPTPSYLLRPNSLPGLPVRLADGRDWIIPLTRQYVDDDGQVGSVATLPRYVDIDDAGLFVEGDIQTKYQRLWDISEAIVRHQADVIAATEDSEPPRLDMQEHFRNAVEVVTVNYYVGQRELAMMHALDTDSADSIMLAAIDWHNFVDLINKKKASDTLSSGPGNSVDADATPQLSAN